MNIYREKEQFRNILFRNKSASKAETCAEAFLCSVNSKLWTLWFPGSRLESEWGDGSGKFDIQRCRKMFLKTICLEKLYLSAPFTFSVRALYTNLQSDFVGFGQISHTLHTLSHSSMRVCGCSMSPQNCRHAHYSGAIEYDLNHCTNIRRNVLQCFIWHKEWN